MKTLVVYIKDSYYKYSDIYKQHIYELTPSNLLQVYLLHPITGEEELIAAFQEWSYFLLVKE